MEEEKEREVDKSWTSQSEQMGWTVLKAAEKVGEVGRNKLLAVGGVEHSGWWRAEKGWVRLSKVDLEMRSHQGEARVLLKMKWEIDSDPLVLKINVVITMWPTLCSVGRRCLGNYRRQRAALMKDRGFYHTFYWRAWWLGDRSTKENQKSKKKEVKKARRSPWNKRDMVTRGALGHWVGWEEEYCSAQLCNAWLHTDNNLMLVPRETESRHTQNEGDIEKIERETLTLINTEAWARQIVTADNLSFKRFAIFFGCSKHI